MRVVVDSSILARDFQLDSSTSRVFLSEVSRRGHELFIPEIVFEEVVNKFEEQLRKGVGRADAGIKDVERLARIDVRRPIGERRITEVCEAFRSELRDKLSRVAKFLDYPRITHEDLVRRALDRRRPFQESGTGYRDALIWWNVVELAMANNSPPIALISANSSDFAASKDRPDSLHQDLANDLSLRSGKTCEVILIPDLETFVSNYVLPELKRNEQMAMQLANGTYPGIDLLRFVQDDLVSHVGAQEFEASELGFFLGIQTANFAHVEHVDEFSVDGVFRLSTGEVLIVVTLKGEVSFDVYIPRERLYDLRGGEPIFVWEPDWNEWFALATTQLTAGLDLRIVFDESAQKVVSAEISSAEPLEEWWRRFPEQ